ncbi:LOW QUALITY PROTEIN: hypothetical protein T265_12772 [Opisthorchis viverrini]|uniref:Uncharacterized protein n=1 Tax=Opisthorchis viverrini TaxID=6198 RepID=A0A074ZZ17_OPIVI|nr:LOW QUALITY PROTEIN: hypothetical protein T265_12772 [Opisthorchis viverrini]KER32673.1 LOW QUALITY PROTEIN: hypothetical protein T265_12772 [Opisthorchis viverrini]
MSPRNVHWPNQMIIAWKFFAGLIQKFMINVVLKDEMSRKTESKSLCTQKVLFVGSGIWSKLRLQTVFPHFKTIAYFQFSVTSITDRPALPGNRITWLLFLTITAGPLNCCLCLSIWLGSMKIIICRFKVCCCRQSAGVDQTVRHGSKTPNFGEPTPNKAYVDIPKEITVSDSRAQHSPAFPYYVANWLLSNTLFSALVPTLHSVSQLSTLDHEGFTKQLAVGIHQWMFANSLMFQYLFSFQIYHRTIDKTQFSVNHCASVLGCTCKSAIIRIFHFVGQLTNSTLKSWCAMILHKPCHNCGCQALCQQYKLSMCIIVWVLNCVLTILPKMFSFVYTTSDAQGGQIEQVIPYIIRSFGTSIQIIGSLSIIWILWYLQSWIGKAESAMRGNSVVSLNTSAKTPSTEVCPSLTPPTDNTSERTSQKCDEKFKGSTSYSKAKRSLRMVMCELGLTAVPSVLLDLLEIFRLKVPAWMNEVAADLSLLKTLLDPLLLFYGLRNLREHCLILCANCHVMCHQEGKRECHSDDFNVVASSTTKQIMELQ